MNVQTHITPLQVYKLIRVVSAMEGRCADLSSMLRSVVEMVLSQYGDDPNDAVRTEDAALEWLIRNKYKKGVGKWESSLMRDLTSHKRRTLPPLVEEGTKEHSKRELELLNLLNEEDLNT